MKLFSYFITSLNTLLLCGFLLLTVSCENTDAPDNKQDQPLTVAVAANVQFAMEDIKNAFVKKYQHPVRLIIGSSGKLTAQIKQGAPYDIFISANMKYPESLYRDSFSTALPRVYALGALVWWTMKPLTLDQPMSIVSSPSIKKLAIANPQNAPYGEEALRSLENLDLIDIAREKLVYGESIAQTNQYIISGVCDLGITAKSIVLSPAWKEKGTWQEIDESLYNPIQQGVIITSNGKQNRPETSKLFYDFMFSKEAKAILTSYGYTVE